MSTKDGKKYLDKNGLSYFRQKLKEELKNEQLWEQGENTDGTEGGVQIAYYGNAVGEASVSEGVAYNYKKSLDEIIPISIKSLSSEEKTSITNYIGDNNYNYVVKLDFSSTDDPLISSIYDLCFGSFKLSVCEYVENAENTSISELSNVKNILDISESADIVGIFTGLTEFSQLENINNENLEWGLLELDNISVNKNSTYIIGISSGAFGVASHSEGYYTSSKGDYSHSEGKISIAGGVATHAEGSFSHAEGSSSHAEGSNSHAEGFASHAEGSNSHAEGSNSHAEGFASHAEGFTSHAEGGNTVAYGDYSHTEGKGVEAIGKASHAEGLHNRDGDDKRIYTVYQDEADNTKYIIVSDFQGTDGGEDGIFYLKHGMIFLYDNKYYYVTEILYEDDSNTKPIAFRLNQTIDRQDTENFDIKLVLGKSISDGSHIEGGNTVTYGNYSHAEGNTTRAVGEYSHTEGVETSAIGVCSHAEGNNSVAIGDCSHAEGNNTKALGPNSHAEGAYNTADGYASHAEGARNKTQNNYEHAQGCFNISNTGAELKNQTISSIGIGSYIGDTESPYDEEFAVRKNAFEVMENGDIYVHGLGDYDGTNAVVSNSLGKKGQSLQECVLNNKGETGNSILFYEDEITTDTNNKADIPTGFSVRVDDLVIDENFNLYKCIEE